MDVTNKYVQRITKDVVCTILYTDYDEMVMCGEIVNDEVVTESTGPTFYQADEFRQLDESVRKQIVATANRAFAGK